MKTLMFAGAAVAALLATAPASAASQLVLSNDYDGNAFVAGGVTISGTDNGSVVAIDTVAGETAAGPRWSGNFFQNTNTGNPAAGTTLTLSNLGAHTGITIDFVLGFLNSWDGPTGGSAPDYFDLYADNALLGRFSFSNAAAEAPLLNGATIVSQNGQHGGGIFFSDSIVDMSTAAGLTFAHTASSVTFLAQASGEGWQGGSDESWGIDDLSVTLNGVASAVPEPASWALMIGGFGLVGGAMRRRAARVTFA
ncbi:PEPxxWA-CTERM sorting domain-containing protein [Sphingomonas sp. 1P06PA]|uniref:PEPxxWA-CTERM sorting domain-containing protein n=1 Tax=Sphingomonas sp. 1P06PA TaxID=554121 RepID=UPI0039A6BC03